MPLASQIEIATGGSAPGTTGLAGLGAASVHDSFAVRRPDLNVLTDHTSTITGALRPGLVGRTVTLQALGAHGWSKLPNRARRALSPALHTAPRRQPARAVALRR
jgi:hypothetical protein